MVVASGTVLVVIGVVDVGRAVCTYKLVAMCSSSRLNVATCRQVRSLSGGRLCAMWYCGTWYVLYVMCYGASSQFLTVP